MATVSERPSVTTTPDTPAASPVDRHPSPVESTEKTSGKATAALVLGILATLAFVIPIAAWILGGITIGFARAARSEIRARDFGGLGRANAAQVLGIIALVAGTAMFVVNIILTT